VGKPVGEGTEVLPVTQWASRHVGKQVGKWASGQVGKQVGKGTEVLPVTR
jgi:hypothetical protein